MDSSKASELAMDFPQYRRSQLSSNTYHALIHLLSHISSYNASIQPLNIPGPKDILEVQETIEGVGDKDMDFTSNKMVLDDIVHMMGIEDMSTQANGFDKEQKLMIEFEQVMKGTENLICDSDLIPLNLGLDKTHSDGGEVEPMDYQVEMEEGEISGDLGIDGNSFDVASADALILEQMEVDEVQKSENVTGNMVYPSKIGNQEKEKGYDSKSSLVNALQDENNSGTVEVAREGLYAELE
ncbi:hypothetical protein D0Y65_022296 [Glycine soja]|uniref:Uncharacterized protein n=1 Tax=Glycine soja TaxID=3848 RepID=A0A445JMY9_GLYSO|nr:hypothetical protein D0Y65_022296 [Glycine soja]